MILEVLQNVINDDERYRSPKKPKSKTKASSFA